VRPSRDYAVSAVGRERGQLALHFKPVSGLFAGADDRQRFVTLASRAAYLSVGFRGSAKLFNGGDHVLRRGVEGLDLLAAVVVSRGALDRDWSSGSLQGVSAKE